MNIRFLSFTALILMLAGCPSTPPDGVAGVWQATPAAGATMVLTLDGDTAGTLMLDQATPTGIPGCIVHTLAEGTWTRTGDTMGNMELVPVSGDTFTDSCTDPANDVASRPLTAAEAAAGRVSGPYTLTPDALSLELEIPDVGSYTLSFTRR